MTSWPQRSKTFWQSEKRTVANDVRGPARIKPTGTSVGSIDVVFGSQRLAFLPYNSASMSLSSSTAARRLPRRGSLRAPTTLAFLFGLLVIGPSCVGVARADERPNIIVIMADDLGYGDVSCYGADRISTPNIDRLADRGQRFTSGYCSASTCTPTRYSFLTGVYAFRGERTGIAPPNAPAIIGPGTETVASLLGGAGYETAVIGKWHLGLGGPDGPDWNGRLVPGPLQIGFDECLLLPTTNDRVPQVYVRNERVLNLDPKDPLWVGDKKPSPDHPTGLTHRDTLKMDWSHGHNATIHNGISRIGFYTGGHQARFRDEDLADRWIEASREFITRDREEPFFLFFSSHDIHVPRMPHERYQGKSELGFRGDAILELDDSVGQLMACVKEAGLDEKTLIVFCSDNGPVLDDGYADEAIEKNGDHEPNGPLTGGKYSVYEGGTRTPLIASWPGMIPSGVSDQIVCTIDLPASLAALVGAEVPAGACRDSENVLDALLGKSDAKGRTGLVQQDNGSRGNFGYRQGRWKLHRYGRGTARNVDVTKQLANTKVPTSMLFDLETDLAEQHDLTEQQPQKLAEMNAALDAIIAGESL